MNALQFQNCTTTQYTVGSKSLLSFFKTFRTLSAYPFGSIPTSLNTVQCIRPYRSWVFIQVQFSGNIPPDVLPSPSIYPSLPSCLSHSPTNRLKTSELKHPSSNRLLHLVYAGSNHGQICCCHRRQLCKEPGSCT